MLAFFLIFRLQWNPRIRPLRDRANKQNQIIRGTNEPLFKNSATLVLVEKYAFQNKHDS